MTNEGLHWARGLKKQMKVKYKKIIAYTLIIKAVLGAGYITYKTIKKNSNIEYNKLEKELIKE